MFLKKSTIKVVAIVATMFVMMGNNCASNKFDSDALAKDAARTDAAIRSAITSQPSSGTSVSLTTHRVSGHENVRTDRFGGQHFSGETHTSVQPALRIGSGNSNLNAGVSFGGNSVGFDVGYSSGGGSSGNSVECSIQ